MRLSRTPSAAPLIFGAIVIALIAGVTGWMVRGRSVPAIQSEVAAKVQSTPMGSPALPEQPPSAAPMRKAGTGLELARRGMATMAAQNAKAAKVVEAGRSRLQSRYQKEVVDPAWAAGKQKSLADVNTSPMLDQADAKPLSFAAQCHTTVCLIGADFPSTDAANDWFTLYAMLASHEMTRAAMQMSTNPDGSVHLQAYGLARGSQL